MIICSCMNIADHDIRAAVDWMRAADASTIITPGKVYRALGKKADCGGCMPLFLDVMRRCPSFSVVDDPAVAPAAAEVPAQLRGLRARG